MIWFWEERQKDFRFWTHFVQNMWHGNKCPLNNDCMVNSSRSTFLFSCPTGTRLQVDNIYKFSGITWLNSVSLYQNEEKIVLSALCTLSMFIELWTAFRPAQTFNNADQPITLTWQLPSDWSIVIGYHVHVTYFRLLPNWSISYI